MRSKQNAIFEVLSTTREIGQLYPARRIRKDIDASGLIQYGTEEAVLCFNVEATVFQTQQLYKGWLARAQGLVNGKRVYFAGYCCGKIDRPYFATCEEFIAVPHVAILDNFRCYVGETQFSDPNTSFTLSPNGTGTLEGTGALYYEFPGLGYNLRSYYFVQGFCLTLDGISGVAWSIRNNRNVLIVGGVESEGFPSSETYTSWTPINVDMSIYNNAGPSNTPPILCTNDYYWRRSGSVGFSLRLRVF